MSVVVTYAGPLFDRAHLIVGEYLTETKKYVSLAGESILGMYGNSLFRYEHKPRTGAWEANIKNDVVATDRVLSDNVVYNSWLEGVSERNAASRFKGYKLWRLTTQDLNRQKDIIAEQVLVNGGFLERLNV